MQQAHGLAAAWTTSTSGSAVSPERQAVFGGLLGATFNFVFEQQLEHLQDGDRFYYLQRLDGLEPGAAARRQLVRRAGAPEHGHRRHDGRHLQDRRLQLQHQRHVVRRHVDDGAAARSIRPIRPAR